MTLWHNQVNFDSSDTFPGLFILLRVREGLVKKEATQISILLLQAVLIFVLSLPETRVRRGDRTAVSSFRERMQLREMKLR